MLPVPYGGTIFLLFHICIKHISSSLPVLALSRKAVLYCIVYNKVVRREEGGGVYLSTSLYITWRTQLHATVVEWINGMCSVNNSLDSAQQQ